MHWMLSPKQRNGVRDTAAKETASLGGTLHMESKKEEVTFRKGWVRYLKGVHNISFQNIKLWVPTERSFRFNFYTQLAVLTCPGHCLPHYGFPTF